jgi:hypothetical protein
VNQTSSMNRKRFYIYCNAGVAGNFELETDSLSIQIGQRISRDSREEMWSSVLVTCKERDDGSLAVEVLTCHPDWDEPVRIASVESNPKAGTTQASALTINIGQKAASL